MTEPKLDLQKLQALMMELAIESLSPATAKISKINIELEISEKLLSVFSYLAESQNLSVDKLLGQAASTGLRNYLNTLTNSVTQNPTMTNIPKTFVAPDKEETSVTDMSKKMEDLKGMLGQLNQFSELLNGLGSNIKK